MLSMYKANKGVVVLLLIPLSGDTATSIGITDIEDGN